MEIGITTFVENTPDPATGKLLSSHERMMNLVEEIELADQVGLDVFAIGEHHRPDFVVSSPAVVLAAAAVKTKSIKLSSGVTVLSSDDPIRVFQDFAHVDLLSKGRAEIMAGRGSFIESFPLFGNDLKDYNSLFSEKLDLLIQLNKSERVTWKGKHRPSIDNRGVYPRPYQEELPIWVAVGGTPESVVRAASKGLPMALAIIGGMPERFVPFTDLYKETYQESGHNPAKRQLAINSHGYIADNSQQAADEFYEPYAYLMSKIGRERGWPPMSREQYDMMRTPEGSLLVGSPQQVIDKILFNYELFGNTRFLLHISVGTMPHKQVMHAIELLGTVVAPAVKKATEQQQ
ncbi:putative LLM family oxidoreductase [Pontibacter ummariensis]|uniref:Probable oxidoreductase, LLM family n=1 Tax=Pontibacter ummariensis TaxID=1610492 RepID=A0A239LB12_9BACT|nr:LLM class flavin-dependent oxidoreductase [Pontibacter ummariensis]PRY03966.1 putative LLM family oxidoreductase [Pontibacter ummariensis]SNT27152.1 probable oxidoreductase, LLM family [Pontibacter ummariensis]